MNVFKILFNSSLTEPDFRSESLIDEISPFSEIQALWTNFADVQATVSQAIAPQMLGRVKFRGTWWRALSDRPDCLPEGTLVKVIGRHRTNILIVTPIVQTLEYESVRLPTVPVRVHP